MTEVARSTTTGMLVDAVVAVVGIDRKNYLIIAHIW